MVPAAKRATPVADGASRYCDIPGRYHHESSLPGGIRTPDFPLRKRALYPLSYREME